MLGEAALTMYRIPSAWSSSRRFLQAKVWLDEINPDWLSLQFVIYAFHPKGLPFGLGSKISGLVKGRRLHVMFHEIWIGFTTISPMKHRILGFFQKRIIKNLLTSTDADLVSTSNGLYQAVLLNNNIESSILPLFSNIPLAASDDAYQKEVLEQLNIGPGERHRWKIMGYFGSLYPDAALEHALEEELLCNDREEKSLAFIGFGRTDENGLKEFRRLQNMFSERINFHHFGELPSERISQLMQIMDLGISCTPRQHLGKSGVFAAMKHHRLEVKTPQGSHIPEYDQEIKKYHKEMVSRPAEDWAVANISRKFLHLLK